MRGYNNSRIGSPLGISGRGRPIGTGRPVQCLLESVIRHRGGNPLCRLRKFSLPMPGPASRKENNHVAAPNFFDVLRRYCSRTLGRLASPDERPKILQLHPQGTKRAEENTVMRRARSACRNTGRGMRSMPYGASAESALATSRFLRCTNWPQAAAMSAPRE